MNDGSGTVLVWLVWLVISLFVFLFCREIVCWYFKINEHLAMLREIRGLLAGGSLPARAPADHAAESHATPAAVPVTRGAPVAPGVRACPHCQSVMLEQDSVCPYCRKRS